MVLAHDILEITRTEDIKTTQNISFDSMLLSKNTLEGLKLGGFCKPSPIQLHGIPLGKCGFDLLLEAKSGTGKTVVFSVVALEKLILNNGLQVIILAPTREIAAQICDVIKEIGSPYKGLVVEVVMGGISVQDDIYKFKNKLVHIVVGSPGRLHYLIKANHIDTSSVRLLVLDEADKLMEKCFKPDIKYIFSVLPKHKQIIMSSATFPESSKELIQKYMPNSQHVCPNTSNVLLGIDQKVTIVNYNSNIVNQTKIRYSELLKILTSKQFKQCLIFCNYQVRVTELFKMLIKDDWPAQQLHGAQEQVRRLDSIRTLRDFKCRILISTDLAARGIDASNVDLVICFEPPYEWTTYLHRIGRAGRYGSYGTAVTILSMGKEVTNFKNLMDSVNCATLYLQDFWTNNIWNHNGDDNTKHTNGAKKVDINTIKPINQTSLQQYECSKLLNDIVIQDEESKLEIVPFETLMSSFDKETKVQSFESLLNSFKTDESENHEIIKYNTIKVPDNLEEMVNKLFNSKQESCDKDLIDNKINANNLNDDTKNNNKLEISIKPKSIEEISKNSKQAKTDSECHNNSDCELMTQLGLPISFGSKKKWNKTKTVGNKNQQRKTQNNVKANSDEDNKTIRNDKNKKTKTFENITSSNEDEANNIKNKSKRIPNVEHIASSDEDNEVINNNKSKQNYKFRCKTNRHPKYDNNLKNESSTDSESSVSTSSEENSFFYQNVHVNNNSTKSKNIKKSNDHYIKWYNQLKYNSKLIEQMVYINEMSK